MDNPERHLREWLRTYYERGVTDETLNAAARACVEYMRSHGWQFEPAQVGSR